MILRGIFFKFIYNIYLLIFVYIYIYIFFYIFVLHVEKII